MTTVLVFHGTTLEAAESVRENSRLVASRNSHDWLGPGAYFFQEAPFKAWKWACQKVSELNKEGERRHEPAVIRLTLNLDRCFDLLDIVNWSYIKEKHSLLESEGVISRQKPPVLTRWNGDRRHMFLADEVKGRAGANFADCKVMELLVQELRESPGWSPIMVRSAFIEGQEVYENSFFLMSIIFRFVILEKDQLILRLIQVEAGFLICVY